MVARTVAGPEVVRAGVILVVVVSDVSDTGRSRIRRRGRGRGRR